MSEAGPSSRTRAASRNSRESTPAPNPTRRTGRDATPAASRRAPAHAANRGTPAPREGKEALPPVSTKTSKAYGSSGKLTGPVAMDINQAFARPDQAIEAALAQSRARDTGVLPVLTEDAEENRVVINQQSQTYWRGGPVQGNPATVEEEADEDEADEEENVGQPAAPVDITAWAIRVAEAETWFEHAMMSLLGILTATYSFFRSSVNWLVGSTAWDRAIRLTCLSVLFVLYNMLYGPVLPFLDMAHVKARLPSTNTRLAGQVPMDSPKTLMRLKRLEKDYDILNGRYLDMINDKAKAHLRPRINWFEGGQGAIVDPYLSSPSFIDKDDFTYLGYLASLFALMKPVPAAPTPFSRPAWEAITHWNDGGIDRWCAPPARGKLQLTVFTARPIAPKELIVEHIEKDASVVIGMAPREIELWVEIDDPSVRSRVHDYVSHYDPALLLTSSPQPKKELADAQALPENFVLVGRFLYDIHTNKAAQSFFPRFDLAHLGVRSTHFAVRVNSNWGSYDATCVNRVRLHGPDMSGEVEALEEPLVTR